MISTPQGQIEGTVSVSQRKGADGWQKLLVMTPTEQKTDAQLAAIFAGQQTVTNTLADTYTVYSGCEYLSVKTAGEQKRVWLTYAAEVTRYTESYLEQRNAELEAALTEIGEAING